MTPFVLFTVEYKQKGASFLEVYTSYSDMLISNLKIFIKITSAAVCRTSNMIESTSMQ